MRYSVALRSFRTATWLGWQIESNWTDPFLFAVYSIVKPLSGAGILVVLYTIITKGNFGTPMFPYIYFGNAFYIYVGAVISGISWAVIDDREHYKTLKYMYVAPIRIPAYWLGRGLARFLSGSVAVVITIAVGVLFLHVPFNLAAVNWLLFFPSLFLGIAMLSILGLILASITLLVAHHFFLIGEAVAAALFLFSGAIFPLSVLPGWLQPIAFSIPIAYWLELMRRSMAGDLALSLPPLSEFGDLQLLGILLAFTIFFGMASVFVFRFCDHLARERGLIDFVTNY